MNILKRALAGVGVLLLALALALDRILDSVKLAFGFTPKRGQFQITELNVGERKIPRRTLFLIASGAAALALICVLALVFPHNYYLTALASAGLMGAAGAFVRTVAPNEPLPIYTVKGVYTGGSSDASPLNIPLPTAFAALCVALAITPIPDVLVVQAIGNVTAGPFLTATNANLVLTFTTSGSGLSTFIATIGCSVPNTRSQP